MINHIPCKRLIDRVKLSSLLCYFSKFYFSKFIIPHKIRKNGSSLILYDIFLLTVYIIYVLVFGKFVVSCHI